MEITWGEKAEELLREWRKRAATAKDSHYLLASRHRRYNMRLGVPAVVLSSVVGTSLFATLANKSVHTWVRAAIGVISVTAAIFTGLQTFLRFGERAEKHVVAADWYASVVREIEQILALPADDRGEAKIVLDRIRKEMNKIGQQSPEIGEPLWTNMARQHGLAVPGTKRRGRAPGPPSKAPSR